jgi:hypothetical protein
MRGEQLGPDTSAAGEIGGGLRDVLDPLSKG